MNKALGAKLIWEMYENPDQLWVKILQEKYLDSRDPLRILTIRNPTKCSAIWNFMLECRGIITKHISWNIGNGEKASFWHDSWNGLGKLDEMEGVENLIPVMEATWGSTVDFYVEEKHSELGPCWVWRDPSNLQLTDELKLRLKGISKDRQIFLSDVWCASKSGCYLAKLGYQLSGNVANLEGWRYKLCWNKLCLPKVGAFVWLALQRRILMDDRR